MQESQDRFPRHLGLISWVLRTWAPGQQEAAVPHSAVGGTGRASRAPAAARSRAPVVSGLTLVLVRQLFQRYCKHAYPESIVVLRQKCFLEGKVPFLL